MPRLIKRWMIGERQVNSECWIGGERAISGN
jgi:hypothetical protein